MKALPWQEHTAKLHHKSVKKDFIIVAGTGCGKTYAATSCGAYAHTHSSEDSIIMVVVPFRAIKSGWAKAFRSRGFEVATSKNKLATDTDVIITTYAGAASVLDYFTKYLSAKLIIIFDEFHHMEETNVWAQPFIDMNESEYINRIFLSGTPWHEKGKISDSMVEYKSTPKGPVVVSDVTYTYGQNVNSSLKDGRNTVAVHFHPVPAKAVVDGFDKKTGKDAPRIYNTENMTRSDPIGPLVRFKSVRNMVKLDGVMDCLIKGIKQLKKTRNSVATAGGIIFVSDREAGKAVKDLMQSDFNENAVLVTSDDPKAHGIITDFRTSKSEKWIIAIDMISEGVDIPRLKVAVDLTNRTTMMHIVQRWGRVLRLMRHRSGSPATNTEAHIFFIAHPQLTYVADEIENDMRKFKKPHEPGDKPPESNFVATGISETSKDALHIFKGQQVDILIAGLAEWILDTKYMDLRDNGYDFNSALLLARHMVTSGSIPDCYTAPDNVTPVNVRPKRKETKQDIIDDFKEIQGRIGYHRFNRDHGACATFVAKAWRRIYGGSWTADNKSREDLEVRRQFMRDLERGR